ncbi:MAG: hypothetical protein F4076_04030 [Acidimicrobiaceae bacterium]|nr:hypothetical protein [Acidimicrobiaceae bacterium]MYE76231.1 hypothetical protein [Acidimicrobiaceae bacterium]MYJ41604.1 hypothetical protein [Acidimicrobiaceae bacterium]MYJ81817.1 hypothetical protein [Acidimicrobiaceae bacterium]
MNTYPVRVGSCLFTMVDPERGHEVAYNRWYERDHFYSGCLIGPWLFAGRRRVATRDLEGPAVPRGLPAGGREGRDRLHAVEQEDLRFPEDSPLAVPVDAGSYLAVHWSSVEEVKHEIAQGMALREMPTDWLTRRRFEHWRPARRAAARCRSDPR